MLAGMNSTWRHVQLTGQPVHCRKYGQ